jgi:Co/Zn/Cd efflux system component
MTRHRRAIGAAALLNGLIVLGEGFAGWRSGSLSVQMDAVHNLSDELALLCLWLACFWPGRVGRGGQRLANLLNTAGLLTLSALLAVRAARRFAHSEPVPGLVPLAAGLIAAAANAGVAALLAAPARHHAAVRLAWLHNRADVLVSIVPTLAGVALLVTGAALVDPLAALAVALWLAISTLIELRSNLDELLWPDDLSFGQEPDPPPGRTPLE